MIDKTEIKKKIEEDEDYIRSPKNDNSLQKFLNKSVDDVEDSTIARFLMLTEEEVEKIYQEAIQMLRKDMVADD